MKKIFSVIIITLLLASCLTLTASASIFDNPIVLSSDMQSIIYNDNVYSRIDASMLEIDTYVELDEEVIYGDQLEKTIRSVTLEANKYNNILRAKITYKDGSFFSAHFLHEDYLEEYEKIAKNHHTDYIIDFVWPENNTVTAPKIHLFGQQITLYNSILSKCDYYNVRVQNNDGSLVELKGVLLIFDDEYYYVDFEEAGIESKSSFYPSKYSTLPAHKLLNTTLLQDIRAAEDEYYKDDLGFLYDDNLTEVVSSIFLIFVFAIIPLAVLIIFLILSIRSKTVYKKMFIIITILSAAELTTFVMLMMLMI